ncbi:MAG TPA: phytanoyl-CoA dioxygenase family protein [Pyrinomonadaceae bacterium]|nr:phytanoyl-CoA dioxygenase family protein [Pyrinomonadaceae bacterium]
MNASAELNETGFAILKNVLDEATILSLKRDLFAVTSEKSESAYGVRNLLNLSPGVRKFSESETVRNPAESFLGKEAKVVRAIFFNKTPDANWKVPWHQDLTIAVREKRETAGFTAWTRKGGIWHAQAPDSILRKMLTLRFHLDDADETNGALKAVAGSHRRRLSSAEVQKLPKPFVLCRASKGDLMLMRPLVVHSSSAGTSPKNRRVIHLEMAAENLPNNLDWYGS